MSQDSSPSSDQPQSGVRPLEELRALIDKLDTDLVRLLNERAQVVKEVGEYKRGTGVPIYAPHRDVDVVDRALARSTGPMLPRTIEAVYREIMSGSFALEKPLRIGYLGPPGSFSHLVAVKHFGSSVEHDDLHTIDGVFTEVRRGHVDYGLVPIENSLIGGIVDTLDAFRDCRGQVSVYAEVLTEVRHTLLANCAPDKVRRIHSKPEVFAQCRHWLATQYPHAELIPAASSADGAKRAAEEYKLAESIGAECGSAAVGSVLAAQIYGLNVLFEGIEDHPDNITRFLVISREKAQPSGDDKTSMMFTTADKPGALVSVLQEFQKHGINLTHIDKRPSGKTNWDYTFFIDAAGHMDDDAMSQAIEASRTHCSELRVLGSYPRARRVR
ncbi:MAG: prephenate dehydratase [Phycisphaeraceae bacterium]|nr:prephenate dehydratase [Phycisphaerales bacterium]MCB9859445.1 prephenate dehydratase [Phycisphaeraceae bacterium]